MESGGATELNQLKVPSVQHLEREVKKKKKETKPNIQRIFSPMSFCIKTVCFAAVASGG